MAVRLKRPANTLRLLVLMAGLMATSLALADGLAPDQGKLLATGGVNEIEGAGGGGLTPWALITGYGTDASYGANLHATGISTQDYRLTSEGIALGLFDRVEFSLANQRFESTGGALNGIAIRQEIAGVKVRVFGSAVYDQDNLYPQVAVGAMYHHNDGISGLASTTLPVTALGARHTSGTDLYVSATKLLLAQSLLLNGTLRYTDANQFGLLGFGGDAHHDKAVQFEASAAYLITRRLALGIEYREKPRNLSIDDERAAYDAFLAYFPTRNASITLAYVSLGTIVKPLEPRNQSGPYLSLQIGF